MDNDFSTDQECTIASVKSITDSQYGKKVQFMISGYPHEVSCFTKFPENMSTGAKVFGHIEVKDGKYHNFKFGKRGASPATLASDARVFNLINLKILPLLEFMAEDIKAMRKAGITYPVADNTNDAHGLDFSKMDLGKEITEDDIPAF